MKLAVEKQHRQTLGGWKPRAIQKRTPYGRILRATVKNFVFPGRHGFGVFRRLEFQHHATKGIRVRRA